MTSSLIVGLSGISLTPDERAFLADAQPAGLILFQRNVCDPAAIRPLVDSAREAIGRDDVLILIDQEGGRVQRIKSPAARDLPPAAAYGELFTRDREAALKAAFSVARLAAEELSAFGVTMNCAPVLDVPVAGAHDVIGDRAYGRTPAQTIALGRAVANGLLAGGVVPVLKHIPGHGRATADSHFELPVVRTTRSELSATDFEPFSALADLPAAMTAHVVFSDIDADNPASTSARVTRDVIRGEIGFDGLLMSDDLSMKALKGPVRSRADAVIRAGSDVALHCNGDLAEMRAAAEGAPQLAGRAAQRFADAVALTVRRDAFDVAEAVAMLDRMRAQTFAV